jgi:hypothetical protein
MDALAVTALAWLDQRLGTPHDLEAPFIFSRVAEPGTAQHCTSTRFFRRGKF